MERLRREGFRVQRPGGAHVHGVHGRGQRRRRRCLGARAQGQGQVEVPKNPVTHRCVSTGTALGAAIFKQDYKALPDALSGI